MLNLHQKWMFNFIVLIILRGQKYETISKKA